jgi:hypothetical protein
MTKNYSALYGAVFQKFAFLVVVLLSLSFSKAQGNSNPPDSLNRVLPDSLYMPSDSMVLKVPVMNISDEDDQDGGGQDVAGLLQASRDVYTSTAGFSFGVARFRIRGYDAMNTNVLINGVVMNDPEMGRPIWAYWGGLNDVTRNQTMNIGISPEREFFTGIGGFSSINARASMIRPGTRASIAETNRIYRHRVMVTHSTGMMANGWAIAASFSRRWAQEGYVDGTFMDAYSYYLGIEKKINDKHTLGLVVFGSKTYQGLQNPVFQEIYDLVGTNFYNPNWGYQNGEKRNSRVRNVHKPTAILTHYFKPNKNFELTTSAFVNGGRGGTTRLNWYEASDPRPNYYRYLPSYFDEGTFLHDQATNNWQNDVNTQQVNWHALYDANRNNLYTVENVDGIAGSNFTGARSKYIVEEVRNDHVQFGVNSYFTKYFSPQTVLSGGVNLNKYRSRNYRQVHDLLGGDFWIDIDQFAERDLQDPNLAVNNVDRPNALIKQGDVYGYDYYNHIDRHTAFAQIEHETSKYSFYAAVNYTFTQYFRESNMRNARFFDNSFGESAKSTFHTGGVKAGFTYKISGRQYFSANAALMTRAPLMANVFISPRTRDDILPGITTEKVQSYDLNYVVRYPKFKARATIYHTTIKDQVWMRSFFHEEYRNLVNYFMTGVNLLHQGVEFGAEWKATSTISVTGVFGTGFSIYDSRPIATISRDNSAELLAENRTVYLKNFRIGGMPQTAAGVGMRYNSPKYWFVGFNFNYFDHIYLDPNPDRRTEDAVSPFVDSDPQWKDVVQQERLDPGFTVDIYGGKSWRLKGGKYFINFNASINNLLNNQNFRIGGFEQLRFVPTDLDRFPPMYSYMFGINFFTMLSLSF